MSANRLTHRLEAMGQLVAGVAHEISSPMQYVGSNASFLSEMVSDLLVALDDLRGLVREAGGPQLVAAYEQRLAQLDLSYIREEVPVATQSISVGLGRIGSIVGGLRELSHPSGGVQEPGDVNHVIESALAVTANTYRYHVDVVKELGPLPSVTCHVAELNQVFVNLIVNAAHAMETTEQKRGRLTISTRVDEDDVVIAVSDTGCGIPETLREKIFEPFFTTKEVGRGTGQGLSIIRSIVTERHGGSLTFESAPGRGTTFFVRLPIDGHQECAA
jgi:signal transduction histidine kinase